MGGPLTELTAVVLQSVRNIIMLYILTRHKTELLAVLYYRLQALSVGAKFWLKDTYTHVYVWIGWTASGAVPPMRPVSSCLALTGPILSCRDWSGQPSDVLVTAVLSWVMTDPVLLRMVVTRLDQSELGAWKVQRVPRQMSHMGVVLNIHEYSLRIYWCCTTGLKPEIYVFVCYYLITVTTATPVLRTSIPCL